MLVGVHALVGELERLLEVVGLVGQQHDAVGGADRELLAALAQRLRGARDDVLHALGVDVDHGAELVAAEPVGLAVGRHLAVSFAPRRVRSASPARWPKVSL